MKTPEEALAEARRRSGSDRRRPGRPDEVGGPFGLALEQLVVWAVIEPEEAEVYSTRRFGAPITAFKRVLIRLMRQYVGQISAQQSRFNVAVVAQLMVLDDRVRRLERYAQSAGREPNAQNARARVEK
jgi:hypothetical protein